MKTKQFLSILAFLFILTSSCSSDDNSASNEEPTATDGFSWTENGGATVKTATNAKFSTQFKTFMVNDANGGPVFEINLDGTTSATYAIGASNAFTYTAVNPFYIANGGNVIITSSANGKVSGTFDTTGTGSGITSIKGTFKNIEVVP